MCCIVPWRLCHGSVCPAVDWSFDAGVDTLAPIGFILTLHHRDTGMHICTVQQELRTSHRAEQLVLLALDYKMWQDTKDTCYVISRVQLALLPPTFLFSMLTFFFWDSITDYSSVFIVVQGTALESYKNRPLGHKCGIFIHCTDVRYQENKVEKHSVLSGLKQWKMLCLFTSWT